MEVTAQWFRKWAAKLKGKSYHSKGQKYFVWDAAVSFCAVPHINDPWYLEKDREGTKSEGIEARKQNVQLRASRIVSRENFIKQDLLKVVPLKTSVVWKSSLRTTQSSSCSKN